VATTSAYLHARPATPAPASWLRENFSPQFNKLPLPVQRNGVMDVMTAVSTAPGDSIMKTTKQNRPTLKRPPPPRRWPNEAAEGHQEGYRRATEAPCYASQAEGQ